MNKKSYEKLLSRLNSYLNVSTCSISPIHAPPEGKLSQEVLLITTDLDVENLSSNQAYLMHSLLHQFYASGGTKELSKEDIEKLHTKVRKKINHIDFDKLDLK